MMDRTEQGQVQVVDAQFVEVTGVAQVGKASVLAQREAAHEVRPLEFRVTFIHAGCMESTEHADAQSAVRRVLVLTAGAGAKYSEERATALMLALLTGTSRYPWDDARVDAPRFTLTIERVAL